MTNTDFEDQRRFLFGLCYRMTGSAADAEDLVQETFLRALERPPANTELPWRPWLVRVAMNLARDDLRRRKRTSYIGPWLPAPIETGDEASPPSHEPLASDGTPATHYDLLESVSFAFLLSLEKLTPQQRAVLLLRDVFEYSVRETAAALAISDANVKTSHHRARASMREYNAARITPSRSTQQRTAQALNRFLACLRDRDMAGLESLLVEGIRTLTDAGGEFLSALRPIVGRDRVIRFFWKTAERYRTKVETRCTANGLPAVILALPASENPKVRSENPKVRVGPRLMVACEITCDDKIKTIYMVSATRKLAMLVATVA
jgi:RNA polymerase sigma-70 factor (ECF subfamily)